MRKLPCFGLTLLIAGLFVPHASHAQKVTTDWAKSFNFAELKRFAWRKNNLVTVRNPEGTRILDQKIMRAVTEELASKGIVEDSSNPDFYLFYHAGPGDEGLQVAAATPVSGRDLVWGWHQSYGIPSRESSSFTRSIANPRW